jgi:membrane complex biogenesis BtpA family protein
MKAFSLDKILVGMVHVGALPGTPRYEDNFEKVIAKAVEEAKALHQAGFGAVMIENMHDAPYLKEKVGPEIVAAMTVVGAEIKKAISIPLGIQILAGANESALSVAQAVGAEFVRVEGFVFAHVADEGLIESCAGKLLRIRRELGAEGIRIFADIKKKHSSHSLTSDVDIVETAKAAEFFGADGLILTGTSTGKAADAKEVQEVKKAVGIPVWVGSGVTPQNLAQYATADGWIVGSSLKKQGHWSNPLDPEALTKMVEAVRKAC